MQSDGPKLDGEKTTRWIGRKIGEKVHCGNSEINGQV